MPFSWMILETSLFTDVSKSLREEVRNLKKNGVQKNQRVFEPSCIDWIDNTGQVHQFSNSFFFFFWNTFSLMEIDKFWRSDTASKRIYFYKGPLVILRKKTQYFLKTLYINGIGGLDQVHCVSTKILELPVFKVFLGEIYTECRSDSVAIRIIFYKGGTL